jgi:hypothetical protein
MEGIMRWLVLSVVTAIVLAILGFFVPGSDSINFMVKLVYWFCVLGFLTAQSVYLLGLVHRLDL